MDMGFSERNIQAVASGDRFSLSEISPACAHQIEGWLSNRSIHQWLDFGGGRQTLSAVAIMVLGRSKSHFIRMVRDQAGSPFAVVGLQHVDSQFRNAMLWYFRADAERTNGIKAAEFIAAAVRHGFDELGLLSVHAWVADGNLPSIALLRGMKFREMGRMRLSHLIDDQPCDRILFDTTRGEFSPEEPVETER